MKAGCHIKRPKRVQLKNAYINRRSADNQCFKYAVLAGLHNLGKNSSDVLRYRKYENELKFDTKIWAE